MSEHEPNGPGDTAITLARVFDYVRNISDQQRSDSKALGQLTTIVLGLVEQGRRVDRRFDQMDLRLAEVDLRLAEMERRLAEMERRLAEMERRIGQVDLRFSDLKDELELMIKAELLGQLAFFRTELNHRIDELADRITLLEGGNPYRLT